MLCAVSALAQDSTYTKIRQYYLDGNYTGVMAEGMVLVFSEPENQESYVVFAAALMKLSELDEAAGYLKTAKKYACTDPYFCAETFEKELKKLVTIRNAQQEGEKLFKAGKTDAAYELMVNAYKSYPEDGLETAISLLEMLIDKKLYLKALDLTELLQTDKRDDVKKMAKTVEAKIGTYSEVIRDLKYNKDYANAEYYYKGSNYSAALSEYEKCYAVFPDKNDVRTKISNCKDHIAYGFADKTNTLASLEKYVDAYPYGIHTEKVNKRLKYNYLRLAHEEKSAGRYEGAIGYYKTYLKRFKTGDESNVVSRELCNTYYAAANYYKSKKEFSTAKNYFQNALDCSHPEATTGQVRSMEFRYKQTTYPDHASIGWQTNPRLGYGLFTSFHSSRRVNFNYSAHFERLMLSSTLSWETDNNSSINATSYPEDYRYSGEKDYKMFFLHAGITKRIIYPLAFYTNFGLTYLQEFRKFYYTPYTSTFDEWAKNADRKITTPSIDVGLELVLNPITFRYGVTYPFSDLGLEKRLLPNFAIGIVFD